MLASIVITGPINHAQKTRTTRRLLPRFGGKKLRIRERQDARTDPFSKISNGNALREELIARNMLDYALTSPLADRLHHNRID